MNDFPVLAKGSARNPSHSDSLDVRTNGFFLGFRNPVAFFIKERAVEPEWALQ